VLETR